MALSVYDASVPVFSQMLRALNGVVSRGADYAAERKIAPEALLGARLFPDMFPLSRQVQLATDHAKGASARLAGVEVPSFPDVETTFEELRERINRTVAFLEGLDPAGFEGAESRDIVIVRRGEPVTTKGQPYLLRQALPNFFFHVTTAYDILRHNGVELGKRDFLGTR